MKGTCFLNFIPTFLLLVSMAYSAMEVTNITADQTALLALKAHLTDPHNILPNNWSTTASVCSWIGVTCGAQRDRVSGLNLSHMSLSGYVPSEIGNLSSLVFLSIRNNNFQGSLPNELAHLLHLEFLDLGFNSFTGDIPPSLGSLPKLKSLLLEANFFLGNLPLSLWNISSLQTINMSYNQLHGFMPSSVFSRPSLYTIDLSFNKLSGEIPMDIFNHLPELRGIYFSRNRLSGSIPRTIGNCTLIEEINFSENNLTGVLPPELGGLTNLKTLRIDDNALIGNVPSALFNISAIEVIGMYANLLSGSLPPTMGLFMPNLRELRLGGNELEGTIPSSISNASTLAVVDLSNNSFTGLIPGTLGNLRQLQVLNLANNHLTSESSTPQLSILSALENCKNLRRIYLSVNPLNTTLPISFGNLSSSLEQFWADDCNLKGNIPNTIGNLSSLIALSLANNELASVVPTATERLTNLQLLDLQGNQLEGNITDNLCHSDSLFDLSLGGNKLSGSIPECLGNLTTLRHLNLSSNNFTSTIPLSLGNLAGILVLNLSSNFLSGSLPLVFRQLMVAEEIDLSRNQLSGQIPNSTWDLKNLAYLSLATNRLQGPIPGSLSFAGEIPSEGPFRNFSAQSYMMNNGLCGAPRLQVPLCKTYALRGSTVTLVFLLELILPLIAATMAALYIFIWLRCPKKNVRPNLVNTRFTYRDLEQATDGFGEGNLLGRGSFGSVYKGTLRDGKIVAIKVFDAENEVCCRSFEVEREVMCNACHPNIITIFCSSNAVNFKALVIEYMVNGSLDKWLYTHNYSLDILQRLDIMINTASALEYLHSSCSRIIIHGDLKPSNILLDEDMISRLSDFSISQFLKPDGQHNSSGPSLFLGTIGYVAPEYGIHGIVSTETDVYSFGILLMETFTGKKPTDEMFGGEMSLRSWIMETLPREIERVVDPCLLQNEEEYFHTKTTCLSDIMRLALMCTSESPVERLNMKVVVDTLDEIKRLFLWNISGDDSGESNLEELYPNHIRNNMKKFVKWRRETLLPNLEWRLPDYQYETNS
ncbi:LRR receptor-like serine/threonine-protein kinase GSO2 isoform X2 [Populus nigra]|uniref:LRR receptor-like serine/threonine-protein kinase GSO2 isoform X2 n=1 Tax=Populus nigra TaxID=3691 RepID=UPI002B275FEC|nr:LRR receptor-like serine/threonine-protein kinase GSO2 isoform X2 [Populus nigra]